MQSVLRLLAATGIDALVVLPFDAALAEHPAREFVRDMLVGRWASAACMRAATSALAIAPRPAYYFGIPQARMNHSTQKTYCCESDNNHNRNIIY